jgi:NAD(P)-dependent dehydrogenase (short-subunit alcohol dehydrogenase family)
VTASQLEDLPFSGKLALVTGAGRGIGRAISIGLAEQGATVLLLSRTLNELEEVKVAIERAGGKALVLVIDVADRRRLREAVKDVTSELGSVDILINNAAVVWPLGATVTVDADKWAAAININLLSVFSLTQLVVPTMLAKGWGRIVNVSSAIAAQPESMIGGNAYATSKAALEAHTRNLAAELAHSGVTVNAYRPGGVDTAMQAWIRDQSPSDIGAELHERFQTSFERGDLLSPEDSARALLLHIPNEASGEIWSVGA